MKQEWVISIISIISEIPSTFEGYIHLNKITSKMRSKIVTLLNSMLSFAEVSTNTTGKLFFTGDRGGNVLDLQIFRILPQVLFQELMKLLITFKWNAYLFHFLAWVSRLKKHFTGPDSKVHWKLAALEKIC